METRDRQYGVENFNTESVKNDDIDIYVNIKQTHSSSPTQSEIDLAVRRSVDEELALSEDSDSEEEGAKCPSQSNEIKINSSFIPIKNSSGFEVKSHSLSSSNQKDGSICIKSKAPVVSDSDDSETDVEQHAPPSNRRHLSDDEDEDSEDDLRLNQIINDYSMSKNTTREESPLPRNHMMLNNGHLKRSRSSSASSYASDSTDVGEVVSYSSEESDCSTCSSPLTCPYCKQAFRTTSEFRKHIRSHTDERPHVCKHCSKCFAQPAQLRRHVLTHTKQKVVKSETAESYECPHCDRVYDHKMKLLGHMSAHNKKEPSTKKKVKFQCDYCQKMFDSQRRYKVHYAAHKNGNLHCCEVCGRSFKMKSYLIVHQRTHTQNKVYTGDRPFACKVCGKAFLSSSNLELHSTIHKYEKTSFPCEVCGKEFSRQSNYLAHARAHHS